MFLPVSDVILASLIIILLTLSICQLFTKRAALKISELLYIMSKNVREKAVMVREYGKDLEILEAHLFDIAALLRLADKILFTAMENSKDLEWGKVLKKHRIAC